MVSIVRSYAFSLCVVIAGSGCGGLGSQGGDNESISVTRSSLELAPNDRGFAETFHTAGTIDRTNPFFTPNGGNGRTCETCHLSDQGWTITPGAVSDLFD